MFGEWLEENCPDVAVKTVIKHEDEWNPFLDSICRSYGFYERSCPIVYTLEGTCIGDGTAFVEHVRTTYSSNLKENGQQTAARTKENVAKIQEEMRKKKGLTLKEKIDEQLVKVKKKKVVEHIDDCFFEEVEEGGCLFQVRRTNVQRQGGRTLDIPDEIEINAQEAQRLAEENAKRDITYEEYKDKFEAHIEGTAKNERVQEESADEEPVNVASKSNPRSKVPTNLNKTASNFNVEDDEDAKSKASGAISKKSLNKSQVDVRSTKPDESYKYDLPESCFVLMMKKVKIEKFKNSKFLLCADPFPMVEGQMILF